MKQALTEMLVKISGRSTTLSNPVIAQALTKPASYIQAYGFYTQGYGAERQQYARITFSETAINQLLRRAKEPIWGANRPTTIGWLAIGDGIRHQRTIITPPEPLSDAINAQFHNRGLPLVFPIMDMTDSTQLTPVEVWGEFFDAIKTASQRYRTDSILTGRLTAHDGHYSGKLNALFAQHQQTAIIDNLTADEVAHRAAELMAAVLSGQLAVNTTDQSNMTALTVQNVSSVADYTALLHDLSTLAMVRNLSVAAVHDRTITFTLQVDGSAEQLHELLHLNRHLTRLSAPQTYNTSQVIDTTQRTEVFAHSHASHLYYRWR